MTVAALLAALDVDVAVVEKNAGTADDPKAISLDDESLRAYQRAGIVADVLRAIVPGTGTRYYDSDNQPVFHARAAVPYRSGYPFKNPFAQPDLERVLHAALERSPRVDLRFSTELIGLEQDDQGIVAQTVGPAGEGQISARYALGADGGRSRVRSLLGITMSGRSHDDVWLVIDALGDAHKERYGMHHGDPRRPYVIVPGLHGRCRYEFYLYPGECDATSDPPFELIQRLLEPHRSIAPDQVERAVTYRFHGLSAASWYSGRAFLLGDAAHMMPPFAGQGLNTGIRDAANLAWKLAAVVKGSAHESLLESYEVERRPHAEAVIRSSERLGRIVMTTNPRIARFRDQVVRRALESEAGRAFFKEMRYRPSTRIVSGAVHDPSSNPLVGTVIGQPLVFDFGSHRCLPFDELLGQGWSVVAVGLGQGGDVEWSQAMDSLRGIDARLLDVPLDDLVYDRPDPIGIAIDLDTRLYSEFEPARGSFVIIRPDRVVAAVAAAGQLQEVISDLGFFTHAQPIAAAPTR
ncbi:monooxygenase [Kribbella qitaiheensis]|uniref:Monooxygenase n=1 Tax=Kribbella qitaiheensis TaxID=1544730 RepID=A0A7G6X538_9ACTN|nr:FAD-dependent monooxygenase [Kribbella qitaiheensis]QNE21353.1 monooxygenase [Kribbella qitaiheensis]